MPLDFLNGASILVTGGTGSFGQKIVKKLLTDSQAARVIVFSRDELKQHQMQVAMPEYEQRLRFFIGDVRDLDRLSRAFKGVDFVIHAAALKQVPALEYNPFEAVKTNILGTQNVINAAIDQHVNKVILISTDKAANPANLYGATKLCAEKLIISGNFYAAGQTALSVVRYGNVFGSRGSIIQLIKDQQKRGELTLTHEDMTRFWITLDQGVNFVLDALQRMHGGEIFIPKIPSMKIKDVLTILAPNCSIKIIGIRPGEKLHEVLVTPEEARHAKEYDDFFVILPEHQWWSFEHYQDGRALPADFFFASHTNQRWLTPPELEELISDLE